MNLQSNDSSDSTLRSPMLQAGASIYIDRTQSLFSCAARGGIHMDNDDSNVRQLIGEITALVTALPPA